jgi:hypothetical protein
MASGQYQLQANFTFPLTTEEYMAFLEHAKTCSDIVVDLSKATFKEHGFAGCLQWLRLMQIFSNGAISKIKFSFESLIRHERDSERIQALIEVFAQSDIFFNFVEITLDVDKALLASQPKEYQKVYDAVIVMFENKKKKILTYPAFVAESKQLFREFRTNLSR